MGRWLLPSPNRITFMHLMPQQASRSGRAPILVRPSQHPVRRFYSHWYHRHAGCRSRLPSTFLRRVDQRLPHKTFHLFVERGHRRHHCGLAGGPERHVIYNGITFISLAQEQRGGLALVNGIVYVVLLRLRGRLRQLPWLGCRRGHQQSSTNVHGWATTAMGGGIWGHGGVASDGTNMFVVTGNTFNTGGNWMGGEAIIRLQAGPTWTGQPTDYWAPTNWFSLDQSDTDLGGVSATVIDVPGATPSQLCSRSAKIRMPTWLIATISVVSLHRSPRLMSLELTEGHRLLLTTPAREHILLFITSRVHQGIQDYPNKSAHHRLRMELQARAAGLALGHND